MAVYSRAKPKGVSIRKPYLPLTCREALAKPHNFRIPAVKGGIAEVNEHVTVKHDVKATRSMPCALLVVAELTPSPHS